jgi:DNA-directed RNA polymerase specialized sigma24 family protein
VSPAAAEESAYAGMEKRLDIVVRLLAGLLTKGMTRKDAILTLSAAGLVPKEVAGVLGVTSNQVSVALYDAKQSGARKAKRPARKA